MHKKHELTINGGGNAERVWSNLPFSQCWSIDQWKDDLFQQFLQSHKFSNRCKFRNKFRNKFHNGRRSMVTGRTVNGGKQHTGKNQEKPDNIPEEIVSRFCIS